MKHLLFFLLFLPVAGMGQEITHDSITKLYTIHKNLIDKDIIWIRDICDVRSIPYNYPWAVEDKPKYDTIPVIILCSDTSGYTDDYIKTIKDGNNGKVLFSSSAGNYHPRLAGYPVWVRGYEVKKIYYVPDRLETKNNRDSYILYEAHYQTDHVVYLDHMKKPLNLMVWMSREWREKMNFLRKVPF